MGSLPVLKPREVVARLERLGFVEVRQRGSHKQFRHAAGRQTSGSNPTPSSARDHAGPTRGGA